MNPNLPEEFRIPNILFSIFIFYVVVFGILCFFSGCQYLPQIADDIEKIADNDALYISCDKDCFQKDTDLEVSVKIINKNKAQP